jgi:hypothetical protein
MGSDHHNTSIGTIQKSHIGVSDSNELHSVNTNKTYLITHFIEIIANDKGRWEYRKLDK